MQRAAFATSVFLVSAVWLGADQQTAPPRTQTSQTPKPTLTFRVESNYIEVDAVVTDSKGAVVRDLKVTDFEVLEDGRKQEVDAFAFVDIPIERSDRPLYRTTAVEPDVSSNAKDFAGRVYLIVLDEYHVDPSRTALVRKLARDFLQTYFGENDVGAVVHLGNPRASQDFTASRRTLQISVDKFIGQKLQSAALNKLEDQNRKAAEPSSSGIEQGLTIQDKDEPERAAHAQDALNSVKQLSQYMAGIHGRRKAVLWFSEGIDFNTDDAIGPDQRMAPGGLASAMSLAREPSKHAAAIRDAQTDMIGTATRNNVSIYTIDPRGVASAGDSAILQGGLPFNSAVTVPTGTEPPTVPPPTTDIMDEIRRSQATLRTFAEQTGGLAHVGSNNFTSAFGRIVQDNSSYYVLGYHAPVARADGKFHNLTVRVKQPGVQVRARKGYLSAKPGLGTSATDQPDVLHNLLTSPMPMSGLPMRLTAQVMKGTGKLARVCLTVEVSGQDFPLEEKDGNFTNRLDLSYAAFDVQAKPVVTGKKTLDLTLKPPTRQAVADHGLRLTTEFEIAPGHYQLRLAGHEALGNRSGSVYRDLDVPDFLDGPLVMSDLLLTSSRAGAWPTTSDANSLKGLLPGPVTAQRDFSLEETLAVFVSVYDNNLAQLHTDDLTATVRKSDGTQIFAVRDERSTKELGATGGSFGYLTRIPIQDFVPGEYILTVEVKSRLGGPAVAKEVQFRVH